MYHFIGFTISEIIKNKRNIKSTIKNMTIYSFSMIVCGALYSVFLYFTGSLEQFIDYTILGIIDFKQNAVIESYIILLELINIIIYIIALKKSKIDYTSKVLFIYTIIMLLICYPILCDVHTRMALIYSGISSLYSIFLIFSDIHIKKENLKVFKVIYYSIILFAISILIVKTIASLVYWKSNYIKEEDNPYFGAVFSEYMNKKINLMIDYINDSGNKVIIISPEAPLYNIKLNNVNNGILDYPVQGNCGIDGEEKIINAINSLSNTKFIITKYIYFQEHINVHKYIMDNYNKIGEIMGDYEVYE